MKNGTGSLFHRAFGQNENRYHFSGTGTGRGQRGLALLLVVSLLTIVAVITVSFVFAMRLETAAATNFRAATQAQYIAEAGISYAKALLHADAASTTVDDLTEPWATLTAGADVDSNDDHRPDARWLPLTVTDAPAEGRFALLIQDEAGKLNVNAAGLPSRSPLVRPAGWSPAELNLEATFREIGLANAQHALGELKGAEAALRRAAAREPDSVIVLNNLAQTLSDQGRHGEALALAERAVAAGGPFGAAARETRDLILGRIAQKK